MKNGFYSIVNIFCMLKSIYFFMGKLKISYCKQSLWYLGVFQFSFNIPRQVPTFNGVFIILQNTYKHLLYTYPSNWIHLCIIQVVYIFMGGCRRSSKEGGNILFNPKIAAWSNTIFLLPPIPTLIDISPWGGGVY